MTIVPDKFRRKRSHRRAFSAHIKIQLQANQTLTDSSTTDSSHDEVTQSGQKNVYTKQNSGGMKINM
jgi:hypothetical protein